MNTTAARRFGIVTLFGLICASRAPESTATLLQVTDPQGRPVAGASVTAFRIPERSSFIELHRNAVAQGRSTDEGRLEIALPQLDRLWLSVDGAGYLPLQTTVAPHAQTLTVSLRQSPPLRGRVAGNSSQPLAGRVCAFWKELAEPLSREFSFERCSPLAPGGEFSLSGVALQAQGRIEIRADGYLPLTALLPLRTGTFQLTQGVEVSGWVAGPKNTPVPLAKLFGRDGGEAETGRDGSFTLRLAQLPTTLTIEARGFHRREITLDRDSFSAPIILQPGPTLEARVLGFDGAPLQAVQLRLARETSPGAWTTRTSAPALREGRFFLDLPNAGSYRLTVQTAGHRSWESGAFTAAATEGVDLGVLQMTTGSGVEGRTVDDVSGKALSGVLVSLLPQGVSGLRRLTASPLAQAVTDRDGRYRLTGQIEGAYELRFERTGFATALREIELPDQRIAAAEDQEMGPGVAVRGLVRSRTGQPRAGLALRFLAESGTSLLPLAESSTGPQGRFRAPHLSSGRYRVEVRSKRLLLSQIVEVERGEAERFLELVTPGTLLTGRVLRGDEPLAGGRLTAEPASLANPKVGTLLVEGSGQPQAFGAPEAQSSAEIDGEGRFSFAEIEPGPTLFRYLSPEGQEWTRVAEVPADATAFLPLVFGGKTLQGQVSHRESGEPLAGVELRLADRSGSPLTAGITDERGAFSFTDISANDVVIEANLSGFRQETVRASLAAAQPAPMTVQLEPADAATVHVRMAHSSGQPLAFAFVSLLSPAGAMVRSLPLDETGEKQFDDVPAGQYRLVWSDPAVGVGASPALAVHGGEDTVFERRLLPPARLELSCKAASCAGLPVQTLALFAGDLDVAPLLPGAGASLAFSADNRAFLGTLQPGDYRLLVQVAGRTWDLPFRAQPGQRLLLPVGEEPQRVANLR